MAPISGGATTGCHRNTSVEDATTFGARFPGAQGLLPPPGEQGLPEIVRGLQGLPETGAVAWGLQGLPEIGAVAWGLQGLQGLTGIEPAVGAALDCRG